MAKTTGAVNCHLSRVHTIRPEFDFDIGLRSALNTDRFLQLHRGKALQGFQYCTVLSANTDPF